MSSTIQYKVFITPQTATNVYGDEIEVTDFVFIDGVPKIRKTIDAGDYDIGAYQYGDINLKCYNFNGKFNDAQDKRSIFKFTRDKAQVRIQFTQIDDSDGSETTDISFRGLINEEGTRIDIVKDQVTFKVLSKDSVIRNTKVTAGAVPNGTDVATAMFTILNNTRISSVLGVSQANINPAFSFNIDDGSKLDNKPTRTVINQLLFASNSVLVIDDSDNIIIKSRDEDESTDILNLFGPYDILGRENIIKLKKYNTGTHRMFNSIEFNDQEKSNSALQQDFGVRQKSFSLDFITDTQTEQDIAAELLDEFKLPKIELEVTVQTELVKDNDLLDRVSVNYPLRVKPAEGDFLPVVGITEIGSVEEPLPEIFGSIAIPSIFGFKIIQIDEDPRKFETTLKLRQIGKDFDDGTFNQTGNSIVGFAIIGEAVIVADTAAEIANDYNPSVVGAAQIGVTLTA